MFEHLVISDLAVGFVGSASAVNGWKTDVSSSSRVVFGGSARCSVVESTRPTTDAWATVRP